jgi:hypothetical protein
MEQRQGPHCIQVEGVLWLRPSKTTSQPPERLNTGPARMMSGAPSGPVLWGSRWAMEHRQGLVASLTGEAKQG